MPPDDIDRHTGELEDLPPLELRKLRDLTVEEPSTPGRAPHLSAGSGIVRRGRLARVLQRPGVHPRRALLLRHR